jgi:cholinesterase
MLVKLLMTRTKRSIQNSLIFTRPKVKVKVEQGIVKGFLQKLPDGRNFKIFQNIPYAKQPVNELRFRSPQKLSKFATTEIDCTREGDASFHRSSIWKKYVGSENCLNLNVYVPEVESSKRLAVMFFIHGGNNRIHFVDLDSFIHYFRWFYV